MSWGIINILGSGIDQYIFFTVDDIRECYLYQVVMIISKNVYSACPLNISFVLKELYHVNNICWPSLLFVYVVELKFNCTFCYNLLN